MIWSSHHHTVIIILWSSHHQKHCLFLSLTKHEWISKIFGSAQFQMSQVHPWNISKCQDMGTAGGVLQGNLETRNYSHLSSQQCTDMTFDLQNDSAIVLKRSNLRAIKVRLQGSFTLNVIRVFSFTFSLISYVLCLCWFMLTN